jgi:hypothetical protein
MCYNVSEGVFDDVIRDWRSGCSMSDSEHTTAVTLLRLLEPQSVIDRTSVLLIRLSYESRSKCKCYLGIGSERTCLWACLRHSKFTVQWYICIVLHFCCWTFVIYSRVVQHMWNVNWSRKPLHELVRTRWCISGEEKSSEPYTVS